jgi:uncharacterized membrane protein
MKIPGPKAIAFMVLRGFGQFFLVTGMVGITFVIGPLNHIIGKWQLDLTADSKGITFLVCLGFCVAGGALDFFANEALKAIDEKKLKEALAAEK